MAPIDVSSRLASCSGGSSCIKNRIAANEFVSPRPSAAFCLFCGVPNLHRRYLDESQRVLNRREDGDDARWQPRKKTLKIWRVIQSQ